MIGVIEKMNIIPILVYINPIGNSTGCWKYSGWILYPGESGGPGILLSKRNQGKSVNFKFQRFLKFVCDNKKNLIVFCIVILFFFLEIISWKENILKLIFVVYFLFLFSERSGSFPPYDTPPSPTIFLSK